LDDLKAQAIEWCERARRLCEAPTGSGHDSLPTRLDLIGAGLLLRRQLDASGQSEDVENARRELLRFLTELQLGADVLMASLVPGTELYEAVARRSRDWLDDVKAALRSVTSAAASDPLLKAQAIEGLRNELEWHSAVIDRLDRETPDPATVWLDVELARLSTSLRVAAGRDPDPNDLPHRRVWDQRRRPFGGIDSGLRGFKREQRRPSSRAARTHSTHVLRSSVQIG
jgi:hypothetical protein